jgi:hypothetical protein
MDYGRVAVVVQAQALGKHAPAGVAVWPPRAQDHLCIRVVMNGFYGPYHRDTADGTALLPGIVVEKAEEPPGRANGIRRADSLSGLAPEAARAY